MALTDITQSCDNAFRAGVLEFYVNTACGFTAATASASNHSFTAITTAADWVKIEADTDTISFDFAGGSKGSGTVTFTAEFEGLNKTTMHGLNEILITRKVSIIMVTNNSTGTNPQAFVLGYDSIRGNNSYLTPSVGAMIEADMIEGKNAQTITFTGVMAEPPREMVGDIYYNSGIVSFGAA